MSALTFFNGAKNFKAPPHAHAAKHYESLLEKHAVGENSKQIRAVLSDAKVKTLLLYIFAYSPFLTGIINKNILFFTELCEQGPEAAFTGLLRDLQGIPESDLMKGMRIIKARASLLIALADIAGLWPLEKVTGAMSEFAAACIKLTLRFLLKQAIVKGDIKVQNLRDPEEESGIFVLAMGKLGAHELNYSSDIDLIVFFEKERVQYKGSGEVQHMLAKMVHEMVRMLQERTAEGYVFRVDLRLRPDPASTLAAMSVAGAMTYYETVGQNWERAAFIKARVIAGDMDTGNKFLKQLVPFIWRKHLDFAAIDDIQSIKRQMDARTGATITIPGHNIKTGIGGIREIEFFAQLHQLIWGGRLPQIRLIETCKTLEALAEHSLITKMLSVKLIASYRFLRNVEHRLQMVDDQQTHSIPADERSRAALAEFLGFADREAFEDELMKHLQFVHENFAGAFRGQSSLGAEEGKLSFTGVENDPQTVETLAKMGYRNPALVSETIQGWHRGARRATRTKRARELITEITPTLLKGFATTVDPDQAFLRFDEFLGKLPAGIQLFSLFTVNPQLLNLIALIMGSAPAMALSLSKNAALLDAVLTRNFYAEFIKKDKLFEELTTWLRSARDFEDEIDIIRRFKNEKQFQAGVQLISDQVDSVTAGRYLSDIADVCLEHMFACVRRDFESKQGKLKEDLAIIVLGRLGARELTFGSDIDMVFVYDTGGLKNLLLAPEHDVYNKLSQRFIGAVTALTKEGRLYEIDTRLRPSGSGSSLAVGYSAFEKYFRESAWTFELMAFTRARVLTGSAGLKTKIELAIRENITRAHDAAKLSKDIADLRAKITREFGSNDPWNIKYAHGGLIDCDFLAQYYVLRYGAKYPTVLASSSADVFRALQQSGLMDMVSYNTIAAAHAFLGSLFALIRLCGDGTFDEATAPPGLKQLLAKILHLESFEEVKGKLSSSLAAVKAQYEKVISG